MGDPPTKKDRDKSTTQLELLRLNNVWRIGEDDSVSTAGYVSSSSQCRVDIGHWMSAIRLR